MNTFPETPSHRSKESRHKGSEVFSAKTVLTGIVGAGAILLAYGIATSHDNEKTPDGPAKNIDTAVMSHDVKQMTEYGVQQLDGSAVVKTGANVRTSPTVSNDEGFENNSPKYTDAANSSEEVVILDNPYVVTDPSNKANGTWLGAEDPDTHEVYWINEAASAVNVKGDVTDVSLNRESHIYIMASPDNNR